MDLPKDTVLSSGRAGLELTAPTPCRNTLPFYWARRTGEPGPAGGTQNPAVAEGINAGNHDKGLRRNQQGNLV